VLSSGVGVESCGKRRSLASACSFSIRILSRALCCVVSARGSVLEARVRRAGEGPAAVIHLFEQALGTQAIYGLLEPDMQQRTAESLSEEVGKPKSQIARLKQELSEERGDNHRLRQRNTELEALVAKDSHNSSRPPSTAPP